MLRRINNYLKLRRFKKALLSNVIDIHTIAGAYEWLRIYNSLKHDTELFRRIRVAIPNSYIETNYNNFAKLMDAVHDASNFYQYGRSLNVMPTKSETLSFETFLINDFEYRIEKDQAIDYITTHINYFIDDLFTNSIDEKSTIVRKTELLIINVVALLKSTLVL